MLDRTRVREVYLEAMTCAADVRAALLDRLCEGDASLRTEVESLLEASSRRPQFLGSPTAGASDAPGESPGVKIGPYQIVKEIGQGGFGSVYLAEQEAPFRRRVALKVIKLGMDTKAVIARFEAERQALAVMDHANIARVFDAGATDSGRPYFVMELVDGPPITAYCDAQGLSIAERLGLFKQVCHAVQHAHSKGIIHRDLKPSNVLVATEDGRPVAKVIDFGVAKATNQRLTEKTFFTQERQLIGTLEYMSPEQAGGEADIDTRTDVYSLGVLCTNCSQGRRPLTLAGCALRRSRRCSASSARTIPLRRARRSRARAMSWPVFRPSVAPSLAGSRRRSVGSWIGSCCGRSRRTEGDGTNRRATSRRTSTDTSKGGRSMPRQPARHTAYENSSGGTGWGRRRERRWRHR